MGFSGEELGFATLVLSKNLPPIIPEFLTGGSYITIMSSDSR